MLDDRKPLDVLEEEWIGCTKCELGVRRQEVGGSFVFGEGRRHGVMFIGEGPGQVEEDQGRPFIGPSGKVLRSAIERLGLTNYYITNCVSCRSCAQAYNGEGQPIFRTERRTGRQLPLIRDQAPTPLQIAACLPRLHELIYLIDPVVIVTLGAEATKTLRGKSLSILSERGHPAEITIPGSWQLPVLTDKRHAWARKVRGQLVMPTRANAVRYLMIPTIHPAFVLRSHGDKRKGNPVDSFIEDVKKAVAVYDRYMLEVHGIEGVVRELEPQDLEGIEQ